MDELKALYERLKAERRKARESDSDPNESRSPLVMVLNNEEDKGAIEAHIRERFGESLPLDSESADDIFLEAHRLSSGELECSILIEYHNGRNGHSVYFQAHDINEADVQAVLGNLGPEDKLSVHLKGKDYQEVAAKLKGYVAVGHAEPKGDHEPGQMYQETDQEGKAWACVDVVLQNQYGLHMRPIDAFLKVSNDPKYEAADINVQKGDELVDGKSILGLMGLGAEKGQTITIKASGEHAQEAVERLQKTVTEYHIGE